MIKYLMRKIIKNQEEPLSVKLREILIQQMGTSFSAKTDFYFIDNFVFEHDKYAVFKEVMSDNQLFYSLTSDWERDLKKDNVVFYLIDENEKFYLLSLFDPYDYLTEVEVLDLYEFKPDDINQNVSKKV